MSHSKANAAFATILENEIVRMATRTSRLGCIFREVADSAKNVLALSYRFKM